MMAAPTRILIGKAGIDKHDRGAIIVARALREAGFEVIYIAPGHSPQEIARVAADEDVQGIGISLHSGAHREVFGDLARELERLGMSDIPLFAGGTIPDRDFEDLRSYGVREVFLPGTPLEEIAEKVRRHVSPVSSRPPVG